MLKSLKLLAVKVVKFLGVFFGVFFFLRLCIDIHYDAAFVGGICLTATWLVVQKTDRMNQMISNTMERLHRYLQNSYDYAIDRRKAYLARFAEYAIKSKKIRKGMTCKEVESIMRELIIKDIQEDAMEEEGWGREMLGVCSKWEARELSPSKAS